MIAVDPNKIHRYVLQAERTEPKEKQTTFLLRALTARERAEADDLASDRTGRMTFGSQHLYILQRGLTGWENLQAEDGQNIPFPSPPPGVKAGEDAVGLVPYMALGEIVNAIMAAPKLP